jgi:hypothetical protein
MYCGIQIKLVEADGACSIHVSYDKNTKFSSETHTGR